MKQEIWKPVANYPGYEVSDHGRVRSYYVNASRGGYHGGFHRVLTETPQRIMKASTNKRYPKICLFINGRCWSVLVHRLVLEAFIGPRPSGMVTCHNDGNAYNNHLDNLRYDTMRENNLDITRHGHRKPNYKGRRFSPEQAEQIRVQRANGATWAELARTWHIGPEPIAHICIGQTYKDCPGPITTRHQPTA